MNFGEVEWLLQSALLEALFIVGVVGVPLCLSFPLKGKYGASLPLRGKIFSLLALYTLYHQG